MMKPTNPVVNRSHPLSRGLVGAWAFQDGGGSGLRDVSGRGNDGTLTNMADDWVQSPTGGALDFDGSTDFVSIPQAGLSVGLNDVTVAWRQYSRTTVPTSDPAYTILTQILDATNYPGFRLLYVNHTWATDHIWFELNSASSRNIFRITVPPPNVFKSPVWAWCVLTIERSGFARLYVDGVLVGSVDVSTAAAVDVASAEPFKVTGAYDPAVSAYYFDGQIDYMAMWHRALTGGEVASTYYDKWALYRPARPIRELYRGKAAGGGAISTGLSAIEAGAAYGAPGLNSGLHAISTGIAT